MLGKDVVGGRLDVIAWLALYRSRLQDAVVVNLQLEAIHHSDADFTEFDDGDMEITLSMACEDTTAKLVMQRHCTLGLALNE
jgi:hypothetical protein